MARKSDKNTETLPVSIRTVASFAGETVNSIVAYAIGMFLVGQAAFVNAAKAMIVLEERKLPRKKTAAKLLREAGVGAATIANARYLVRAYEMVTRGIMEESVFDTLTYRDAYHLVRLADKHGGFTAVHTKGWLALDSEEWASLYNHGCTVAEWDKREADRLAREDAQRQAQADASTDAPDADSPESPADAPKESDAPKQPDAAPDTPATPEAPNAPAAAPAAAPPVSEAPAPAASASANNGAHAPRNGPTAADFSKLLDSAQKMAEDLILDERTSAEDREAIHARAVELVQAVTTAAEMVEQAEPAEKAA